MADSSKRSEHFSDAEMGGLGVDGGVFGDKAVRMGFIRKVYGILTVQLVVTFGAVLGITLGQTQEMQQWMRNNYWLLIVSMVGMITFTIIISCFESMRRRYPQNFICLSIFTTFVTIMLCFVVSAMDTNIVVYAVGITLAIFLGLTAFAFQTKIDFTVCNQMAFVFLLILIVFGILAAIIRSHILSMVYAACGALLFCLFLVIDTQMIIGGGRFSISPEEYILAAVVIYMDIINLFLYILRLLNGNK